MSPKRGDRVAPPPDPGGWDVRFATNEACRGWDELCRQAAANTLKAWTALRTRPDNPTPTPRHHRLKGRLASALHGGTDMEQWQIEVTGAGRIWYLVDPAERILWIRLAATGHPAETD